MPIYEYKCPCGATKERNRSVDDRDIGPSCDNESCDGGVMMVRTWGVAGVIIR